MPLSGKADAKRAYISKVILEAQAGKELFENLKKKNPELCARIMNEHVRPADKL